MKEASAQSSPISQPPPALAPAVAAAAPAAAGTSSSGHQQQYQKWQAQKNVVLLSELYYCHDSLCFKKITFRELTVVAAYFKNPWGNHRFLNAFTYFVSFCHSWFGQPTRSSIKGYNVRHIFTASGVHPIIIPPLLSTEAPNATGPSLVGGHFPSPGRRVSGLGGPELVRPMIAVASATAFKLLEK